MTAPEFVAMTSFGPPDSMVKGYNRGDRVPAAVVDAWDLTIGEDGQVMPLRTDAVARPEDDDRTAWEAFAIGRGWSQTDAREATLSDLKAIEDPEPDEHGNPAPATDLPDPTAPAAPPERPADGAKKAEWVTYAIGSGADEDWARADGTTKADLQAWMPDRPASEPDPVAASATEQANG